MYVCVYSFEEEDRLIPGYSMTEIDYYAWIPHDRQKKIPNHRLTLVKNLMTGEYEFHRVYMNTEVRQLMNMGLMVTQSERGITEVAYKTKSFDEAIDWGNKEWNRMHGGWADEKHDDQPCQHVYPHKSSFCRAPQELQERLLDEKLKRNMGAS